MWTECKAYKFWGHFEFWSVRGRLLLRTLERNACVLLLLLRVYVERESFTMEQKKFCVL